ncbi:MAG: DNA polymerase III subunit delta [Ignavibacterium sp.]
MSKQIGKSITEIKNQLKRNKFNSIYFLYGDDEFALKEALDLIENSVQQIITNDFDKQTFYGSEKSLADVIDFAQSFPFVSEKKLAIVKEFEKMYNESESKLFLYYLNSPADFTILVLIFNDDLKKLSSKEISILTQNDWLYEGKELREKNLIEWLISYAKISNKNLSSYDAQLMIELIGEDRYLLKTQFDKIILFLDKEKNITSEIIQSLVSNTKEYTIFNLQDAIGVKDKTKAFQIAFNLLENEKILNILGSLNKYFMNLSKIPEMIQKKVPDEVMAKKLSTHPFYLRNYKEARKLYSDRKLNHIAKALLEADLSVKTSATDEKTILTKLLTEIFN